MFRVVLSCLSIRSWSILLILCHNYASSATWILRNDACTDAARPSVLLNSEKVTVEDTVQPPEAHCRRLWPALLCCSLSVPPRGDAHRGRVLPVPPLPLWYRRRYTEQPLEIHLILFNSNFFYYEVTIMKLLRSFFEYLNRYIVLFITLQPFCGQWFKLKSLGLILIPVQLYIWEYCGVKVCPGGSAWVDSLPGTTICVGWKRAKERNEANEIGEHLTVGEIVERTIRFCRQASANQYRTGSTIRVTILIVMPLTLPLCKDSQMHEFTVSSHSA